MSWPSQTSATSATATSEERRPTPVRTSTVRTVRTRIGGGLRGRSWRDEVYGPRVVCGPSTRRAPAETMPARTGGRTHDWISPRRRTPPISTPRSAAGTRSRRSSVADARGAARAGLLPRPGLVAARPRRSSRDVAGRGGDPVRPDGRRDLRPATTTSTSTRSTPSSSRRMVGQPWDVCWSQANAGRTGCARPGRACPTPNDEAAWWIRKSAVDHYADHLDRLPEWVEELVALRRTRPRGVGARPRRAGQRLAQPASSFHDE